MMRTRINLQDERGVALVVVMVFGVLMLMLVATMLAVGSNEVLVSGLQRDATRALEHAQAGVEDAVRRMEGGRNYRNPSPWPASLASGTTVQVTWLKLGVSGGIAQIRSDALLNRARRRIGNTVMARVRMFPPNIVYGYDLSQAGTADVTQGDVYAQTFIKYKSNPSATSYSYSGWGIRKLPPGAVAWCYTHDQCVADNPGNLNVRRWFPGHRRTVYETVPLNQAIGQGTDTRRLEDVLTFACTVPGPVGLQTIVLNGIGYQAGDKLQSNTLVTTEFLYGCEDDLIPYTYVREPFTDGDGNGQNVWFKVIAFEDWFDRYWCFNAATILYAKCNGLEDPAQAWRGAVPPFPPVASLEENYDEYLTGGGTIDAGTTLNLGCYTPPMSCPGGQSVPKITVLDDGNYEINANLQGHGTLLVDGNLLVNGNLEYWGTLIVNGTVTLGSGTVIIHGGLVAKSTAELSGTITLEAGGSVGNVPVGPLLITSLAFWER